MKTFILENIYMSDMSAPSVCSTDRFPTFESAMEEAHKQFKEEAKTYRKSYGADNITTEECYRDLYIKVPYPFDCNRFADELNKKFNEKERLTPAQRLFFWTEYKKPIE